MSSVIMVLICMAGAFVSGWMYNDQVNQRGLWSSGSSGTSDEQVRKSNFRNAA